MRLMVNLEEIKMLGMKGGSYLDVQSVRISEFKKIFSILILLIVVMG